MAFGDLFRQVGWDECWPWTGYRNHGGYGVWKPTARGRSVMAHRKVYEEMVGPIPESLVIDHLCRNRGCVNPAHMEPVTIGENVLRGETIPARNRSATECPRGHPYTEANTKRKPNGWRECRECDLIRKRAAR